MTVTLAKLFCLQCEKASTLKEIIYSGEPFQKGFGLQ